jgi:hypothetical protein
MKFRIVLTVILLSVLGFLVSVTSDQSAPQGDTQVPQSSSDDKAFKSLSIN